MSEIDLQNLSKEELIQLIKDKEIDYLNQKEIEFIDAALEVPDINLEKLKESINDFSLDLSSLENDEIDNSSEIKDAERDIEKQVEDISENFSNVIHEIANQFYNSVEKITEFKKENYPDFRQFISWESFFQDYSLSMTSYIRTLLELVHEDNKHDFYQHVMYDRYLLNKDELVSFLLGDSENIKNFIDLIINDENLDSKTKNYGLLKACQKHYARAEMNLNVLNLLFEKTDIKEEYITQEMILNTFYTKLTEITRNKTNNYQLVVDQTFEPLLKKGLYKEFFNPTNDNKNELKEILKEPNTQKVINMQHYKNKAAAGALIFEDFIEIAGNNKELQSILEKMLLIDALNENSKNEPTTKRRL